MDYFENTELSEKSKKLYNNKLHNLTLITKTNHFPSLFANPRATIMSIREHLKKIDSYTAPTLNAYIKALMAYRKYHSQEFIGMDTNHHTIWNVMLKTTHEQANDHRERNEIAPSQLLKGGSALTINDIITVRDRLPDNDIRKLLIAFYTMIPPMRADYGNVKIIVFGETIDEPNVIVMNDKQAVMRISEFKTAKQVGPVKQVLPAQLRRLLEVSLKANPRSYVFGPFTKGDYFSSWANKKLSELFDVPFTLTMFRHAYINNLQIDRITVEDRKHIAYLMGQSFNATEQDLYRHL